MRSYAGQPIGTVPELRRLRREAPEQEKRLLRALKESFPNMHWRHQSPVGPYKADFLCFREQLVIEVDGDTHAGAEKKDANRTRFLERQGYRVIRFTNADIMQNLDGVITALCLRLQEMRPHSPSPSGEGGSRAPARRKGEDRPEGQPTP